MSSKTLPFIGKTIDTIEYIKDDSYYGDVITFTTSKGTAYSMYHSQSCCEEVYLDDICGDLLDLIGNPLTQAEVVTNVDKNPEGIEAKKDSDASFTWTFYKLATKRGSVTLRWYGSSNGYYSESIDIEENKDLPKGVGQVFDKYTEINRELKEILK